MINKINNNQVSEILKETASQQAGSTEVSKNETTADASLQVSYDAVIEEAQQTPSEDAAAVERARQLILSGELDSAENVRQAAENIADYGV